MTRDAMLDELEACCRTALRLAAALERPQAHAEDIDRRLAHVQNRLDKLADAVSVATLRREYRQKTGATYRRRKAR